MRIALIVILLTTAAHAAPCPPATPKLAAAEAASFPSAIDAYGKAPLVYVCDPVQVTTWVVYVGRTP